jgi:hypothetical protein
MLTKITLALTLIIAALALTKLPSTAGPDDHAQIQSGTSDRTSNSGGAGGNLVPLW